MEEAASALSDIVERVRCWIFRINNREDESPTMSREFWMPDRSCRMCYECDSQFTLFNRRHHCRICGRVFCGRCTLNTIPASLSSPLHGHHDDNERVRVCNFCFNSRTHAITEVQTRVTETLVPSSSVQIFSDVPAATESAGLADTHYMPYSDGLSRRHSSDSEFVIGAEASTDRKHVIASLLDSQLNGTSSLDGKSRDQPSSLYEFCRSDDEEDYDQKNESGHRDPDNEDNSGVELDLPDSNQGKLHTSNDSSESLEGQLVVVDRLSGSRDGDADSSSLRRRGTLSCDDIESLDGEYNGPPMYEEALSQQPAPYEDEHSVIDYESNGIIWVPPPPEDEEDEVGMSVVDDEDDEDDEAGWVPRMSGSVSSSEYRSKAAMRAITDGHFRALVTQLLIAENVQVGGVGDSNSWLEIVSTLALQAANLVKPDTSKGGGMDPGGYVKVKCIGSGKCNESLVVKGVVCHKNVQNRRMTSRFKNPRLLLLGGALEYQRVSNQLSSLDTLLQQERDHLSMTVARIEAHHPNVLLVEKTVSRFAQDRLLAKEISVVLNVKRALLERIARCTGAQIVSSPDNLMAPKAGQCELFHIEKFVEEYGLKSQGGRQSPKYLMFFEGCPRPLGCTVLLRGANTEELKKVKKVVQFAVFAAYHLALETSFLADEGATLSELPSSHITVVPGQESTLERSMSFTPKFSAQSTSGHGLGIDPQVQWHGKRTNRTVSTQSLQGFKSSCSGNWDKNGIQDVLIAASHLDPLKVVGSDSLFKKASLGANQGQATPIESTPCQVPGHLPGCEQCRAKIQGVPILCTGVSGLSISFSQTSQMTASEPASHKVGIRSSVPRANTASRDTMVRGSLGVQPPTFENYIPATESGAAMAKIAGLNQEPIICKERLQGFFGGAAEESVQGERQVFEQEPATPHRDSIENSAVQQTDKDDFPPSPSDHQSILVSLSSRCLRRGTVCERPHLKRIKYYGSSDKPLGKFLKDSLFNISNRCGSYEEPLDSHVHCYTHRQGSLTISVQRLKDTVLPGEKDDKIWMWHRCLRCVRANGVPPATRRVVMSDAAWGLSFGKFLELSFSNHAAASRVAACGHSLHRDCLRFYGFGNFVACFRYATINLHSVYVPPPQLEFNNPGQQDWLKVEASEVADKGNLVFAEVFNALRVIGEKIASSRSSYCSSRVPEARRQIVELEGLLQSEKAEFEAQLERATPSNPQPGRPVADILALNKLRRYLTHLSGFWDIRVLQLTSFLQLRKLVKGSDSVVLDDLSTSLSKDSRPKSTEFNSNVAAKQDAAVAINTLELPELQSQRGQADGDISVELSKVEKTSLKEDLEKGPPYSHLVSEKTESAGDEFKASCENADEQAEPDCSDPAVPDNATTSAISSVTLLERKAEERAGVTFLDSPPLDKQVFNPLPFTSAIQGYSVEESGELCQESDHLDSKAIASLSSSLERGVGVRRSLSEGYFPTLTDVSVTLQAAWTGEGCCSDVTLGHEMVNGYGGSNSTSVADGNTLVKRFSQELTPLDIVEDEVVQVKEGVETGDIGSQASAPSSPLKASEKVKEGFQDLGGPFSSVSKGYSQSGSTHSSVAGSPPKVETRGLRPTPFMVSHTGQMALQGAARIHLLPGMNDTVIAVYDDEPTSIIAYAISSQDYQASIRETVVGKDKEKIKEKFREKEENGSGDSRSIAHPLQSGEKSTGIDRESDLASKEKFLRTAHVEQSTSKAKRETRVDDPLVSTTNKTVKVQFTDGKVDYRVLCFYAKQFDALRKRCCGGTLEYIISMSRCKKWGAHGGKSNAYFARTRDDRFVVKQVTSTEKYSFLEFAPQYFNYLCESLNSGSPTCLAKILGFYTVTIKHAKGAKEMDLLVMENLLYARHVTRLYDLKGSVRSRYNSDSSGVNKVLLDQNLLEAMPTSPIFVSSRAKRLLERAVWNDTAFLAGVYVMDYSLLVGVDEERQELVLGIIDFIRQYTWDKHLETWVKASGILGGPKNAPPTVISPKQYKKRFRKAMSTYFVMVPDHWSPPPIISHLRSEVILSEETSIKRSWSEGDEESDRCRQPAKFGPPNVSALARTTLASGVTVKQK